MKKFTKKILSLIIAAALVFGTSPIPALEGLDFSRLGEIIGLRAKAASYSGECGNNLTWSLDTETGELIISGTGEMTLYTDASLPPWYSYRSSIKTLTIGSDVRSIGQYAFRDCDGLESVIIDGSVKSIGGGAFQSCSSLESVTIGDSVIGIGAQAFYYCSNLRNITIGKSVKKIYMYAFYGCKALNNVIIPDSVTEIDDRAFSNCTNLKNITIGESVVRIGAHAFYGCKALNNVIIPDSVTEIDIRAFMDCINLESVTIGSSVTEIGSLSFDGCESLSNVYYNGTKEQWRKISIGANSVLTDSSVQCLDGELLDVKGTCDTNLTWILDLITGELMISGTGVMTDWSSSSYAPWYDYRSNIKTVTIGDSVKSVGAWAFCDCDNLESITIPASVEDIAEDAFKNCSSLTSINVDEDNGNYSSDTYGVLFNKNKTTLIKYPMGKDGTSYTVPSSVTFIQSSAFSYCNNLTSITISALVKGIDDGAFINCNSLASIIVDEDNGNYSSDTYGVLFNKDKTTLVKYPVGNERTSYTVPSSVTFIQSRAFSDCRNLTDITIPDSVTSIASGAFWGSAYYNDASNWEDGVLYIGNYLIAVKDVSGIYEIKDGTLIIANNAFWLCDELESVTIPNSVKSIPEYAFSNCTGLESITIGNSVKSIGYRAFEGCTGLTDITLGDSVTSIGSYAFRDCAGIKNITIPDSVTNIGSYAFSNCAGIKNITIPDSVINIGSYAFSNCAGLESVKIGNSVTSLEEHMFLDCESLTSVTFGKSVIHIINSFSGCTSLSDVYFNGTEEDWWMVSINDEAIWEATIHFISQSMFEIPDGSAAVIDSDNGLIYGLTIGLTKDALGEYIMVSGSAELSGYSTYLGTGTVISVRNEETGESEAYSIVIFGDINGDGLVTSADQTLLKKAANGSITLEGAAKTACDVNADGIYGDSTDYAFMKQVLKGNAQIDQTHSVA